MDKSKLVCFLFLFCFVQKERKILENKRLDLDAAKGKLRKAKGPESSKLVSNIYL